MTMEFLRVKNYIVDSRKFTEVLPNGETANAMDFRRQTQIEFTDANKVGPIK